MNFIEKLKGFIKKKHKPELKERLYGGIIGLAVGDALGVPVENMDRSHFKNNPVKKMISGVHIQPKGTWSDDTSLTLCLADSLAEKYEPDYVDISRKMIQWYTEGYWTANGGFFDLGIAIENAIKKMIEMDSHTPYTCGSTSENQNGNGSLMRILPLAYYFFKNDYDMASKARIIHDISAFTHGHNRSKMACVFYVEFVLNLLHGLTPMQSYKATIKIFNEYPKEELQHFNRLLSGKIHRLSERKINSTGYVIDTLEASIWCFLTTKNYKDAVLKAVNLGGDTDTTAAVTGGIAGTYYGINSIKKDWIDTLARKDDILNLCEKFYQSLNKN